MGFQMIIESVGEKTKDWMKGKGSGMAPQAGGAVRKHNEQMEDMIEELDEPVNTKGKDTEEEEESKTTAKRGFRKIA